MAKLNARGAKVVIKLGITTEAGHTGLLVLRSDGKVLRRWTGEAGTGYNIVASVQRAPKGGHEDDPLGAYCKQMGYTVTKVFPS